MNDSPDLKLFISFSGGRSSAYMCKIILETYPLAQKLFIFANTGEEHWKTLEFVNKVDKYFNLNLIWVEAKVNINNKGTTHTVVNYNNCSRKGEPFEEVIKKYGIPNQAFPHCTRELKLNPMYSYLKSIGWKKGTYKVALGIRIDEPKRIDNNSLIKGIIYPLVDNNIEKLDVLEFWKQMPFDLDIEEHQGNCKTCWKKSDKKHIINIKENRSWYNFFKSMEIKYGLIRSDLSSEPRVFFRSKRSTDQMLALADILDKPDLRELNRPEENSGCSESCEVNLDE